MTEPHHTFPLLMNRAINNTPMTMNIWQQNLNKLDIAQQDLINSIDPNMYNILILQELYIDFLGNTHANQRWYPLLPSMHHNNPKKSWTATFINNGIFSSTWQQTRVESQDIVVVSIDTTAGPITIFNIYNDSDHSDSLQVLWDTLVVKTQHPRSINQTRWYGQATSIDTTQCGTKSITPIYSQLTIWTPLKS